VNEKGPLTSSEYNQRSKPTRFPLARTGDALLDDSTSEVSAINPLSASRIAWPSMASLMADFLAKRTNALFLNIRIRQDAVQH